MYSISSTSFYRGDFPLLLTLIGSKTLSKYNKYVFKIRTHSAVVQLSDKIDEKEKYLTWNRID